MLATKTFPKGGSKPTERAFIEQINFWVIRCDSTIIYSKNSFESNEFVFRSLNLESKVI